MSDRDLIILGCSSQQPTRFRNHGAYLLLLNKQGFLFDPGEGTQRQFIFADVAPPVVNRIFISHFHGDHCLGLGSFLMRLNLDKVTHPIHCYYPASGKKYFDRLRFGTIYHDRIQVIEHPVFEPGLVHEDEEFCIEADFLQHGVDNVGWRIQERDFLKFDKERLNALSIKGLEVRELTEKGRIIKGGKEIRIEEVSYVRKGDVFAVVIDTRICPEAIKLAKGAKMLLTESTYLESEKELAVKYLHMTAKEAALLAREANVEILILTHFSARYPDTAVFEQEARTIFPNSFAARDLKRFDLRRGTVAL